MSSVFTPVVPGDVGALITDTGGNSLHADNRLWRETNCYADLWIELLVAARCDPVPALACALSTDFRGDQWTFLKPLPDDLRRLYGFEIAELTVWRGVLDHTHVALADGAVLAIEVDSWWLPDTAGTDYRSNHVKTTIAPLAVDSALRTCTYIHNAGVFALAADDFDGVFGLTEPNYWVPPPYIEIIRRRPDLTEVDAFPRIVSEHLGRSAAGNPVARLAAAITEAVAWLPAQGSERFHSWAFATLRQCGASAELAADVCSAIGAGEAAAEFLGVAAAAKTVQFKLARAARGRAVDVTDLLSTMAAGWQRGIDGAGQAIRTTA